MIKILILEDDNERIKLFKRNFINAKLRIVKTVKHAIEELIDEIPHALFLDHDLGGHVMVESGGKEETGYDVAKFLVENPQYIPQKIYIHSLNPSGQNNIKGLLPSAEIAPFIWGHEVDFNYFDFKEPMLVTKVKIIE